MNEEITIHQPMRNLSAAEIKAQVDLIQQVMRAVMKEDVHYGVIPGCDKPSLYKPGAEKLSLTFHLRPVISNKDDIQIVPIPGHEGHREVQAYCHIISPSGEEIATGVGSCSTMESKYRYRGGEKIPTGEMVPREYWNLKDEGKLDEAKKLIGGSGYGVAKIDKIWQICEIGEKMENSDIADTYNTVLKMAKKRAYIDGILSATAASDIFTQDIEDMPEEIRKNLTEKGPEQPLPEGVIRCDNCHGPLGKDKTESDKVADWCRQKSEQYGGKMLCRNCQPKTPQRKSEKEIPTNG